MGVRKYDFVHTQYIDVPLSVAVVERTFSSNKS